MHRARGILLDDQEAALAAFLVREGVKYVRRTNGAVPDKYLKLAEQLTGCARNRASIQVEGGRATAQHASVTVVAESGTAEMAVQDAAPLIGVSRQWIRVLCQSGALAARQTPAGWRISTDSAAAMAARRKETG